MKIVIAPDSFKESMSALEAAEAIEKGFEKSFPEAEFLKIPMADGGEGTVNSLIDATKGKKIKKKVTGPLGTPVEAFYGLTGDGKTAVIEMAAASGLHLVPKKNRNPLDTTTKGTGQLIKAALDDGVEHIIIGVGGSATNDGGAGMAQALGVKLLDKNGEQIGYGGGNLGQLSTIDLADLDPRIAVTAIDIACDVDNPLTGDRGAAAVFGPQKGATPDMVKLLDRNLGHYSEIIKKELRKDVSDISGAGAAGGLGAGLLAFLNGKLRRGVDVVIEAARLEKAMEGASLVITGEGKIDQQTSYGKTPMGVAKLARKLGIPVIGIAGAVVEDRHEEKYGETKAELFDAVFSIAPGPVTLDEAMTNAVSYTEKVAENISKLVRLNID